MIINIERNDTGLSTTDINENISNRRAQQDKDKNSQSQIKNGCIFAGNLNIKQDNILLKKQQAQKKAMKVVGDVWGNDKKIDDDLKTRKQHIQDLKTETSAAFDELKEIRESKNQLKETFGISDDSQEQKDLELLEKSQKGAKLTEEESNRLKELGQKALTEYQSAALSYNKKADMLISQINIAIAEIDAENAAIHSIKISILKTHPMTNAQDEADTILENASKEIKDMLIDEAKEHIDKEMEEKKEAAEEKTEKEEEKEKKLEESKEKKETLINKNKNNVDSNYRDTDMNTKDIQIITEFDKIKKVIQEEIKEIMDNMNLLDEDLKGAVVDSQI